jgi:hypothetical protein
VKTDVFVNSRGKVVATMPAVERASPVKKGETTGSGFRFTGGRPVKSASVRTYRVEADGDLRFDPERDTVENFHGRLSKFVKSRPDLETTSRPSPIKTPTK